MIKGNSAMNPFTKAALYALPILATFTPMKSDWLKTSTVSDAMAQDKVAALVEGSASQVSHSPKQPLVVAPEYNVPFRDFSTTYPDDVVDTIAANNSQDSAMLVFYGTDPENLHPVELNAVRSGADAAKAELGLPVAGILSAPGDGTTFSIKINGATPSVYIKLSGDNLSEQVKDEIQRAVLEMRGAGLMAKANTLAPVR